MERRRRPESNRRSARDEACTGCLRRRAADREDRGAQSGEGGAGEGEARPARLVRRAGDESLRRQGQPTDGERAAQGEAWSVTRTYVRRISVSVIRDACGGLRGRSR